MAENWQPSSSAFSTASGTTNTTTTPASTRLTSDANDQHISSAGELPNSKAIPDNPSPNHTNSSGASHPNASIVDESATNGFTTAPATSEEDNLDYESDDDDEDDSRSNYSTNNASNNNSMITNDGSIGGRDQPKNQHRQLAKGEEKRSHHNVLERKRRDLLKDSFTKLRDSVPSIPYKDRVSRAEILKQAADFIQSKVQSNAKIRNELEELMRKNRELEEQRKSLTIAHEGAPNQ